MIEIIFTVILQNTFQFAVSSVRLLDIALLIMIFFLLVSYRDGYYHKMDVMFWCFSLFRIVYITGCLLFLGFVDARQFASVGYFLEFLLVYFIVHFYRFKFQKLWTVGLVLMIFNNILAIFQGVISNGASRGYGLIGSTITFFALPYILYGAINFKQVKWSYRIAAIVGILGSIMSLQRTLMAVLVLGFLLYFFLYSEIINFKKIINSSFIVIGIILATHFFLPDEIKNILVGKFSAIYESFIVKSNNDSIGTRYALWEVAIKHFFENPFFGIGSGMFARLDSSSFALYTDRLVGASGLSTHNQFLENLTELGLIGFLMTYGLIYYVIRHLRLKAKKLNIDQTEVYKVLYVSVITLTVFDIFGQGSFYPFWLYLLSLLIIYINYFGDLKQKLTLE